MNFSEVANKVIDLAGKIRAYYETELRKIFPNYPLGDIEEEEKVPPPPEEKELSDFLATLPEEMIYQLMLLVHLNRGKVRADNLAGYCESLRDTVGDPEEVASQMMRYKSTLADELSDGLDELLRHKINVDKLPLKKVKLRKR